MVYVIVATSEISDGFHLIFYTFLYAFYFLTENCINYLLLWWCCHKPSLACTSKSLLLTLGGWSGGSPDLGWALSCLGTAWMLRWLCSTLSLIAWASPAWRCPHGNGRNKSSHGNEFQASVPSYLLTSHWPKWVMWLSSGSKWETLINYKECGYHHCIHVLSLYSEKAVKLISSKMASRAPALLLQVVQVGDTFGKGRWLYFSCPRKTSKCLIGSNRSHDHLWPNH